MKIYDFKELKWRDLVEVTGESELTPDTPAWRPKGIIDVIMPPGYVPGFFTFSPPLEDDESEDIILTRKGAGYFICFKVEEAERLRTRYKSHPKGWYPTNWEGDILWS